MSYWRYIISFNKMFWKYLLTDRDAEANWILPKREKALGDILFKFKRFAKTSTKYKE